MLNVQAIDTYYGQSQILFGMSLSVQSGEVISLMGRNGMGKTTTVRSIMGLTPIRAGEIRFKERPISGLPSYRVAKSGIPASPSVRERPAAGPSA